MGPDGWVAEDLVQAEVRLQNVCPADDILEIVKYSSVSRTMAKISAV
jgi:hypothetical protein